MKFAITTKRAGFDGRAAFARMQYAFEQAWQARAAELTETFCTFANRHVRMRIAGRGLAKRMGAAFAHLITEFQGSPDLSIDLWDAAETAIPCPLEPEPVEEHMLQLTSYVEFGLILGGMDERFLGCQRPHVLCWFDRRSRHVVASVAHYDLLSVYDCGKPLHFPLLLWHREEGVEVIHAALVSRDGQGVLFAGKGGAGKSSLALACLEAGFTYLGDDYISLDASNGGGFVGHSLYSATWVMADHLACFPGLAPYAAYPRHPDREKTLVLLSQVSPRQLSGSAPIRVIVLPHFSNDGKGRIRSASKAEAILALAPTTINLLLSAGPHTLDKLARLAASAPCYWLEFGPDMSEIPSTVDELLARADY